MESLRPARTPSGVWPAVSGGRHHWRVTAVIKLITFEFLLTLYSRGNVIVLVIVHFINNWFMILVAVYVYLKINAIKSLTSPVCLVRHALLHIFAL